MGLMDDLKKHITENNNKPDRVVFGIGIGKNCILKTVIEAFVEKLYDFQSKLSAEKSQDKKQRIINERSHFLKTYKLELLPNENSDDLLKAALKCSRQKEDLYKSGEDFWFGKKDKGYETYKEAIDEIDKDILGNYVEVSKLIRKTIEKENELLP